MKAIAGTRPYIGGMRRTLTGLDVLIAEDFVRLRGRTIGVLCNQASVASDYSYILDRLLPGHQSGAHRIGAVFGPEHGLFGHTQDNMIEWEGAPDARTGLKVFSLYGQHRKPTPEMLAGLDLFVVDIQDVGSRYYTFVWTMAHCVEACADLGIPVMVLDRPNPIGGVQVEGPVLQPGYESFVGLHPVPTRHGMTSGEIARYVRDHVLSRGEVKVVTMPDWDPSLYLDEFLTPWSMPSPNMPTVHTATVYPGGCLLEATNLSEGRGTTRPFEIVGAPFLDGWELARALNALDLPGVTFRPLPFEPTFNKYARQVCEGVFIHVTDRRTFAPVLTYVALLQEVVRQVGLADPAEVAALPATEAFVAASPETTLRQFCWKRPPYEYEFDRQPIDLLAGNAWLGPDISRLTPLTEMRERMGAEVKEFTPIRDSVQLYPRGAAPS